MPVVMLSGVRRLCAVVLAAALAAVALVGVTAPAARADGLISVDQWVAQTQGRVVGNGQCAITVEDYLAKVYGVKVNLAKVPGYGAYGFAPGWDGGAQMQAAGFSWSTSNADLQNGDVLVWSGGYGGLGHVGIWYQGKVYDSNSLYRGRVTTSGAPVANTMAAALEGSGTQYMLSNTGGAGTKYSGRWRRTPPINGSAGSAPNPQGSATPPNTFPTLAAANIRPSASTASAPIAQVAKGTPLTIDCYVMGQMAGGTAIWDHVPALKGYVSDSLLVTGSNSAVVPLCPSGGTSGQLTWANAGVYRLSTDYQAATYGTAITTLAKNTPINIDCWVLGKGVPALAKNGSTYTDYVWYHLPSYPGWISDASVQTTTDNATVGQYGPPCALGTIQGPFPVIGSTPVFGAPNSAVPPVTTLAGGARVSIDCTTTGTSVTNSGTGQTSTLWDHVTGLGYIPDVFVLTGVNSAVAPTCVVATPAPDAPTVQGSAPTVTGDARVGGTLRADAGGWSTPDLSFQYSWTVFGSDAVLGTGPALQVPASAAGQQIILTVTGDAARFEPTALSAAPTAAVGAGVFSVTRKPRISGTARVGKRLRATPGTWSPSPTRISYTWFRNGHKIKGAKKRTHRVTRADRGKRLSVRVTVSAPQYDSARVTVRTHKVKAARTSADAALRAAPGAC